MTCFDDVAEFHRRFDLPVAGDGPPRDLTADELRFRLGLLIEELAEYAEAAGARPVAGMLRDVRARVVNPVWNLIHQPGSGTDPVGALDALVDLAWVAMGTAHFQSLPFDAGWDEVRRANLEKVRATGADDPRGKRGAALDVVKPAGWRPPNHARLLALAAGRHPAGWGWRLPAGVVCDCEHRRGDACCGGVVGEVAE